jgi:short-subunit dehydrogenase
VSRLAGVGVVLTGATGGIGAALCAALCAAGAHVYAVGRDPERLARLGAGAGVGRVVPIEVDLAAANGPARVRDALAGRSPAPAILVLGAAVAHFGLFAALDDAALRAQVDTNLLAPMRLVHALLPLLARAQDPAVVAIGSTFGSLAYPGFAAYSASKFGLRGFIEALGREHADGPVRFQYLSPRATRTAFNPAAVDALNSALRTAVDEPEAVAAQLLAAIERGDRRRQLGWPEKFFARLNGVFPALVDRALAAQLPVVRRFAQQSTTRVGVRRAVAVPTTPSPTSDATP